MVSASSHMGFCAVAHGFQSSPWCPNGHYLGHCTVCLGISAHRPCLDLSVYLQSICLSPVCLLFCRSDWLANPITYASFRCLKPALSSIPPSDWPLPSPNLSHILSLPTYHQDGLRFVLPRLPPLSEPSSPPIHPRDGKERGVNSYRESL
jgi:hypothetical protein